MKRFSEQLKKKSETVILTAVEKRALEARLISFMEYHPLPTTAKTLAVRKPVAAVFHYVLIPSKYVRSFAGVCVLLIVIGIPALAERTIPGDILYPVKVQVTEEIRGSLNRGSYEKVVWETTRLERRISEARQLAEAGRLTPEVEADVLEAVKTHKDAAEAEIATLRTTDAEGATLAQITLATALDIQSAVLKANDTASTTEGMSTVALAKSLDAGREEMNGKGGSESLSVERLTAQLEIETTRCYELLKNISSLATEQEQKDVARRLADVDRKIEVASSHSANKPEDTQAELRAAWSDVQKLIAFMTDIDVRGSISIESLVPVVLTEIERSVVVRQQYEVASKNLERITLGLSEVKDEDIVKKITLTLPRIKELLLTATTTLATDIGTAESTVSEAKALTDSIIGMTIFPVIDAAGTPIEVATSTVTTDNGESATTSNASTTKIEQ